MVESGVAALEVEAGETEVQVWTRKEEKDHNPRLEGEEEQEQSLQYDKTRYHSLVPTVAIYYIWSLHIINIYIWWPPYYIHVCIHTCRYIRYIKYMCGHMCTHHTCMCATGVPSTCIMCVQGNVCLGSTQTAVSTNHRYISYYIHIRVICK